MSRKNKNSDVKCLVQYGDVLKKEVNSSLFQYTVTHEKLFADSEVVNDPASLEIYKEWRKSKVLYDSDLKEFLPHFKRVIKKNFNEVCECLKIKPFKIHSMDIQLTSHNDGELFRVHQDKGMNDETEDRMITFVYYFHSPVKKFSGGELLFPENGRIKVEPVNNTIIFFNPILSHEVLPVSCPGKKFKNGRFSINGWLLKKPGIKSKRKSGGK